MTVPPLIVHVVYRLAVGGLENGVINLVNRLPRDAWRHAILAVADVDPAFAGRIARDDVSVMALNKRPGHAFRHYAQLHRWFRKLRPAIVHTRNLAALEVTVPAWTAGVPVRVHGEHGREADDLEGHSASRQRIRRLFRPFVTRYVAVSPDLADYLARAVSVPSTRIEQIFNGVDTERFHPATLRGAIEGCPFVETDQWLVGTVGRLDTVKAQVDLAQAFVRAINQNSEARRRMRLVVVGEGKLRNPIERVLDVAGMRHLAWLPGERNDVARLLQGLDCFVLPSHAEGVSNTLLEAMACGLPVIATRVGANAELVVDGVTGSLVPAADHNALASAIQHYFATPTAAKAHGRAARARAEQSFGLERMVERYHRLYGGLVRTLQPPFDIAAAHAPRERAQR
jgi:sugar transferase (PEP-CTERM/EpsH1 system associated)